MLKVGKSLQNLTMIHDELRTYLMELLQLTYFKSLLDPEPNKIYQTYETMQFYSSTIDDKAADLEKT